MNWVSAEQVTRQGGSPAHWIMSCFYLARVVLQGSPLTQAC